MENREIPRKSQTKAAALGRLTPRSVSDDARLRFEKERRNGYLRRIGGGPPDERQSFLIDQMMLSEWRAFELEERAKRSRSSRAAASMWRQAAEYRRQLLLADRELARATPRQGVVVEIGLRVAGLFDHGLSL